MLAEIDHEVSIRDAAQCYLTVTEEEARIRWDHNLIAGLLLTDHTPAPGVAIAACYGDTQLMVKRDRNGYDYLLLKGDLRRENAFAPINRAAAVELMLATIRGEEPAL